MERLWEWILQNPLVVVLLVASIVFLLIAEYNNYQRELEIDRLCEWTGPHDVIMDHPRNNRERVETFCGRWQRSS